MLEVFCFTWSDGEKSVPSQNLGHINSTEWLNQFSRNTAQGVLVFQGSILHNWWLLGFSAWNLSWKENLGKKKNILSCISLFSILVFKLRISIFFSWLYGILCSALLYFFDHSIRVLSTVRWNTFLSALSSRRESIKRSLQQSCITGKYFPGLEWCYSTLAVTDCVVFF